VLVSSTAVEDSLMARRFRVELAQTVSFWHQSKKLTES